MKISFFKKTVYIIPLIVTLIFVAPVFAQDFLKDLSIEQSDVRVSSNILKGDVGRIYVTVHNNSYFDLSGVVKFYDERTSSYISPDQPVSILSQRTDDVYIDFDAALTGNHRIAVRVVPWDSDGDNPGNNKVVKSVYVDVDSDGDGIGDNSDPDDDNDGVPDVNDALPFNPSESIDSDGDGIGDNSDPDDDNDGVLDAEDMFPIDPNESKDTDGDGVGDNRDVFPYDSGEWMDSDGDGVGDNADPDDENHGPIPFIHISDTKVRAGKSLTFNSLKSRDPDGEIVKHEWDFGDGTVDTGVIVDHVFEKAGEYIVTLKVIDDHEESREQQVQVKIKMDILAISLIITTLLLLLLLIIMLIPGHRFHHKKMRMHWKAFRDQ